MEKKNSSGSGNIASRVKELILPAVESRGVKIWDVEYVKEAGEMILRITIDKENGNVDIDDCEGVHRAIDPLLDEADPVPVSYRLEVSSPGLERVLRTPEHLDYGVGKKIEVKLFRAVDGAKNYVGTLLSHSGNDIEIDTGDGIKEISHSDISRINTVFDFNDLDQEGPEE